MQKVRWFSFGIVVGLLCAGAFGFAVAQRGSPEKKTAQTTEGRSKRDKKITFVSTQPSKSAGDEKDDGKLRILCFGAHPDDCEIRAGGVGALWAEAGHHVKFVSATNGDIGHWLMAGGPLAVRRTGEVQRADRILGVSTEVLDIHDGELMPTLENRRTFTRLIREWNADIVMSHRPNDYHPDHRYTGILTQDSAFMVAVPYFCPETPYVDKNPAFLFYSDSFERPNPFRADVAVSIDSVIEKKLEALLVMESQFIEGGALGYNRELPKDEDARTAARERARANFERRFKRIADKYRDKLVELYGKEKGEQVKYAEAFEVCEYGRRPSKNELLKLFPFFPSRSF